MRPTFPRVALSCALATLLGSIPVGARAQAVLDPLDLSSLTTGVEHRHPAASFDGASHLVVWEEGFRIWGARLNVGGAVEQGPFEIAPVVASNAVRTTPAVAALGPGGPFLVVWAEEAGTPQGWDIRGARVSASGVVLDAKGFDVSTTVVMDPTGVPTSSPAPGAQERPAVAASGSEFLVVWQDGRADAAAPDIFGARVRSDGTVADAEGLAISQEITVQRSPSLASNGAGYLVAWDDGPAGGPFDVFATRVDASTWMVEPDFFVTTAPGDQLDPKVSSNGSGFLIVWNHEVVGSGWQLVGTRMDAAGAVLDPGGIVRAPLDGATSHALASDGSGWLVAFERNGSGVSAVRVGASGPAGAELPLATAGVVAPGQALSFGGLGRHLAVHREDVAGVPQLAGVLVTTLERLTVTRAGSGSGSVASAPPGIDCGATCAADFETGSEVLLTATAAPGSSFGGWSGGCAAAGTTCTATMAAPATAIASFVPSVPGQPAVPTYSEISTTSLRVSWGEAANATSYRLERAPAGVTGAPGTWTELAAGLGATTFVDSGVAPATTYWYRVRGTNGGVDGPASSATSVTTAVPLPGTPGTPTFASVDTSSAVVSWGAAAYAVAYEIDRAPDVSGAAGTWALLASSVATTSYQSGGLGANTPYWFRVRATNATGAGEYSTPARAVTLPEPPGAPTFSNVGGTTLTVSWTAPASGASAYDLVRGTSAAGPWTALATGTSALTYADSGLAAGATYWYQVRAVNSAGAPGAYAVASVATLPGVPGTPTFGSVTTTSLVVSWTAPAGGAASYDLERGTSATGPWTPVVTVAGTSAPDSGLVAGTTYFYRVRAATTSGPGDFSAAGQVITLPAAPGTPVFSPIYATSVTVSWSPSAGAAGYELERAPDATGAPGTWTRIATVTTASAPSTGLTANTKYWYRVRATNASGKGDYSQPASVVTLPTAPGGPSYSSITTTSLSVSWTAPPSGAASYDLDRATSSSGPWTPLAVTTTALTYADAGLTAGTTYWYRVRATNSTALSSGWATAPVSTLPGTPAAPTFSGVDVTTLTVSWAPVTGATGYRLEQAVDDGTGAPGTWTEIAAPTDATSPVQRLAPNTVYWYRLRATNASGTGAYSEARSVMTLPRPPGTPMFSSVTMTSLVVSWSAPSGGASSYVLERAPAEGGPWEELTRGGALSYADAGLTAGTAYWYRVRAVNAAGGMSAWSTAATLVTLPAAPDAPTFTNITAMTVMVHWTGTAGSDYYEVERAPDVAGEPGTPIVVGDAVSDTYLNDITAANTVYWYRVRGGNASGYGPWSTWSRVSSLPGAPPAPTFSNVTAGSVTVSWTGTVDGSVTYVVERATASTGPWTAVTPAPVTGLSYTDTGLSPGTTYWYRVRAVNVSGTSTPSSIAAVTTLQGTAPGTPAAPTFSAVGTGSVTIAWGEAAGATGYELERAPDASGAPGAWSLVVALAGTSYTDAGLAANTRWWYRVRATTSGLYGPHSSAASVTTLPNAPGTPSFGAVSATSLTVGWTAPVGGAARYDVERAPDAAGPWVQRASGLADTSYLDPGLASSTTYHYRVRGRNAAGGSGAWSPSAWATTLPAGTPIESPGAPVFSSVSSVSLRVGWSGVTGATTYEVERAADEGGAPAATWTQVASTTSLSWFDTGKSANTVYWYRVRASTPQGAAQGTPAAVMTAPGAPGSPTFGAITASSVEVAWTAPASGAAAYDLERAPSSSGPWEGVASGIAATDRLDSGLLGSTTYFYRVRAVNAAGVAGAYAPARSVATLADTSTPPPGAPGTPTFTSIFASAVTVGWSPSDGAVGYELERAASSAGPWTRIATLAGTSFQDAGRTANTTYWYQVRGWNAGGAGAYAAASSVVTAPSAPGTPTFSAVGDSQVTVSWTAPAGGAATYSVERATLIGAWEQVESGLAALSYTSSGLAANTAYRFRVRASSSGGALGTYSSASSVTTLAAAGVTTPAIPGAPTYSGIASSTLRVSWTAATGATGYRVERALASTGPWTQIAATAATSYTDAGRSANTVYWYRVCGSNAGGLGEYSAATSVRTAPNAPGAPAFSAIGATSLTLAWTAPPGGAATYAIERAPSAAGPWVRIASTLVPLAYTNGGLTGYTTYCYRVVAANASGVYGVPSPVRTVTTLPSGSIVVPGAPAPPTFSTVAATSLTVGWTAVASASSYEVERGTAAGGPWTRIASLTGTTFRDTGRSANETYWYRVRAANAGGPGAWSEARSVTMLPNAPGAPAFGAVGATTVELSWTAPSGGAASYTVERAATSTGPWVQIASGLTAGAHVDTGVVPGTTYWYRVRAANADGALGAPSAARWITTPAEVPAG